LRRARMIAKNYRVILKGQSGNYEGHGVEIAEALGRGRTAAECFENTRNMMVSIVADYLGENKIPPISLSQAERTKRVRVYVTSEERLSLEAKAVQSGAAGISEYVRAVALSK
jgi:hypothetical protein